MADQIYVGRRKTSVARVILRSGEGKVTVNGKPFEQAFPLPSQRAIVTLPLQITESMGSFDLKVNVRGGGVTGQMEAIRLGITRALVDMNPDSKPDLKKAGLLTRDPRMVERKKYGRPKARKRFQFSKR